MLAWFPIAYIMTDTRTSPPWWEDKALVVCQRGKILINVIKKYYTFSATSNGTLLRRDGSHRSLRVWAVMRLAPLLFEVVLPEICRERFLTQMGELWRLLLVQPLIVEKRFNTIHMNTDKKPFSQALFQYQIVWGFLEVFKPHCRARWSWRDDASAHPSRRHR